MWTFDVYMHMTVFWHLSPSEQDAASQLETHYLSISPVRDRGKHVRSPNQTCASLREKVDSKNCASILQQMEVLTAWTGDAISTWTQTPGQSKPRWEPIKRPAQELWAFSRSCRKRKAWNISKSSWKWHKLHQLLNKPSGHAGDKTKKQHWQQTKTWHCCSY